MTTRVWIGGATNDAYQGSDWSPSGTPQPGDALYMYSGALNMAGGDLAGDTLNVGTQTSYSSSPPAVVNLSGGATLTAVVGTASFTDQAITFNASGADHLNLTIDSNYYATMTTTVNIAASSRLTGTFAVGGHNGELTINGAGASAFDNDGASSVGDNSIATINADVLGAGSFSVGSDASLNFLQSVSHGESVNLSGSDTLGISDPQAFLGQVNVTSPSAPFAVDLAGIVNADSYSYRNDMLTLYSGNKHIDTLRFADTGGFQVAESGSGVTVGSGMMPPDSVLLPVHHAIAAGTV